jgi:transposase
MANILKMANIHAIIGLLENKWTYRRIARELGVDRETVARYDRLRRSRDSKPAIVATGSGCTDIPNPAISTAGSESCLFADLFFPSSGRSPGRPSECEPLRDTIKTKLEQGLSAQRIFQDITSEHGFTGSYSSVKRFVQRLEASTPLPFRRMEPEPGAEIQVDFGSGAWIIEGGKKRRSHVLRVTLSHSRKSYSEPVFRQTTENFIRAIENAFRHFGGVTKTMVIDNLKAAVKNADWFDPDLNPKVVEFARHYGCVILPTKPYTPRHKGKIESGIKYVKNNALKGRIFSSLAEEKIFLADWETNVADTRIHGTTKKQVRRMFEEERAVLQPLPLEPFPFYQEGRRQVHRDGHVEVAKSYYSVPPEYLGREVWVRWDSRLVRVFNSRFEQISVHSRVPPGRFNTSCLHLADKKISAVERGAEYLLSKAVRIGDHAAGWARAMLKERGIQGVRVLQGFVSLTKKYPAQAINRASKTALSANMFRLRPLRELIKRTDQTELNFTEEHEIIRPLTEYQHFMTVSFKVTDERNENESTT